MIGQDKLTQFFSAKSIEELPKTMKFFGEWGCGKHTLCHFISDKFKLIYEDITDNLNLDYIEEMHTRVSPFLYVIDGDKITEKEENTILKFIEEPPNNAHVCIVTSKSLLPTIENRCVKFHFAPYSKQDLRAFCDDARLLDVFTTPGKLLLASKKLDSIENMYKLAITIFTKIGTANFPNVLTILNKFDWENKENDKYDLSLFLDILLYVCKDLLIKNVPDMNKALIITSQYGQDNLILHINEKMLMEHFLTKLYLTMRGEL